MIKKRITIIRHTNCNECQYCEFPDANGKIPIPDPRYGHKAVLVLSKTIMGKDGKEKLNPILARCGVDGKRLTALNGCKRWFEGSNIIKRC